MNPEMETGLFENPRKSLKPITMCWPVPSTAIEVSDCVDEGPSKRSSSPSQSGSFTQIPAAPRSFVGTPATLSAIAALTRAAARPIVDICLSRGGCSGLSRGVVLAGSPYQMTRDALSKAAKIHLIAVTIGILPGLTAQGNARRASRRPQSTVEQ